MPPRLRGDDERLHFAYDLEVSHKVFNEAAKRIGAKEVHIARGEARREPFPVNIGMKDPPYLLEGQVWPPHVRGWPSAAGAQSTPQNTLKNGHGWAHVAPTWLGMFGPLKVPPEICKKLEF